MAVLTDAQLAKARLRLPVVMDFDLVVNFNRVQIHAAFQALEDWYEGEKAAVGSALNAATDPVVLDPAVKKAMVIEFLRQKLDREEAG